MSNKTEASWRNGLASVLLHKGLSMKRMFLGTMYLLFSLSGFFAIVYPSALVQDQVGVAWSYVWSVSLFSGSFICLIGVLFGVWIGEYAGLSLLGSGLLCYSISAIAAIESGSMALLAYGLILLATDLALWVRWLDVCNVKNASLSYLAGNGVGDGSR